MVNHIDSQEDLAMTAMQNVIAFRPRPLHSGLRRPASLIRAAREGQQGRRRSRCPLREV